MAINWVEHERQFPLELIKEGKTKKVWGNPDSDMVCIENTDIITAYNGVKRMKVSGKGYYLTQISNNCFKYLHMQGVPTHFMAPYDKPGDEVGHKFWARKLAMFPVEFVVRHQPYGSYLERFPDAHGTVFTEPVIEFFEKHDDLGDPWLTLHPKKEVIQRWLPDRPQSKESFIDEYHFKDLGHLMLHRWTEAIPIVFQAAQALQKGWNSSNATLVDIKFECGITSDDRVVIVDTIDADSWRLWKDNDPAKPLDRQLFKNNVGAPQLRRKYESVWFQTQCWLPPDID